MQFCGDRNNYQLIVSRRDPKCPVDPDDDSMRLWGFTLVRRMLPSKGRRSSMYVYLAPEGTVPSFEADGIKVLPGRSRQGQPAVAYAETLSFGTCIKLYNYRWRAKSIITTDGRYELERLLHTPCLPFRVSETRDFNAHYFEATVIGGWASATAGDSDDGSSKLEDGFPAYAELALDKVGKLPYQIAVFKQGTDKRHVPHGVYFVVNGQVHGSLPADFVSRRLQLDYLKDDYGPLLVTVDCTGMNERVREDFFMASRDRVRRNEIYLAIEDKLAAELRSHPGLQEVNQRRRQKEMEKHLDEEAPLSAFQELLKADPTLSQLFATGDRLVTKTGPGPQPPFVGRKFPTYFRLVKDPKGGLIVPCPVNRSCHVEFETDAVNDYFQRIQDPGTIQIEPTPDLCEHSRLWNGRFEMRLNAPWNAQPGDRIEITVRVTDIEREARAAPFVSTFTIKVEPEVPDGPHPGGHSGARNPTAKGTQTGVALALPRIKEVRKEEWDDYSPPFNPYDAVRVKHDGQGGYDYFINVDNAFLLTEMSRANVVEKPLLKHWFTYGLVLAAVGMIKHNDRLAKLHANSPNGVEAPEEDGDEDDLDKVGRYCTGVAQVIVPIIRTLGSKSPN